MPNEDYTEGQRRMDLCREADRILAEAGLNIFGRGRGESKYEQRRFEQRMQTGAYGANQSRRK